MVVCMHLVAGWERILEAVLRCMIQASMSGECRELCRNPGNNGQTLHGISLIIDVTRFSMGIVSHQGLIYIVGGCTHSRRHMQELVSYNPVTNEWTTLASMLVPRSQMGCVVLNEFLYVLGGTNRHNEVLQVN